MKKIALFFLCALVALSICACGKKDTEQTQATTTVPATENTTIIPDIIPDVIDPTIETNIPDPNVDTSMPDMTEGIDSTDGAKSRSGMFG